MGNSSGHDRRDLSRWLRGVAAGVLGAVVTGLVVQFAFDPAILAEEIPGPFGLSGLIAGWIVFLLIGVVIGVIYAAITRIDDVGTLASRLDRGPFLGLVYGVFLWLLAMVIVPFLVAEPKGIGEYAVSPGIVLTFLLFGTVIGVVFAFSPDTE